jgi:ABC-type dipeptide/oligopeptide/nickel transport system permease component
VFALITAAVPNFVAALFLILVLSVQLNLLPATGLDNWYSGSYQLLRILLLVSLSNANDQNEYVRSH